MLDTDPCFISCRLSYILQRADMLSIRKEFLQNNQDKVEQPRTTNLKPHHTDKGNACLSDMRASPKFGINQVDIVPPVPFC